MEHRGSIEHDRRAVFNLGYAVGLIVGEGAFTGDFKTPTLTVKLHEEDPEPLYLLRGLFGGKIYGPYCHNGRRYRVWHLRGDALYHSLPTLIDWMPPSRKREQLLAWVSDWGFILEDAPSGDQESRR